MVFVKKNFYPTFARICIPTTFNVKTTEAPFIMCFVPFVGQWRLCRCIGQLTNFILETPKGVLAKSEDPDQMPHNVASDLGLHYFASCSTIFQQKYLN